MEYIIMIVSSYVQILFFSLFILYASGRNMKVIFFLSLLPAILNIYYVYTDVGVDIIHMMCQSIIPWLLVQGTFVLIFKQLPFKIGRSYQARLKKHQISEHVDTLYFHKMLGFTLSGLAIVLIAFTFIFLREKPVLFFSILILLIIVIIFMIYRLVKIFNVKEETVILLVGKDLKTPYQYQIPTKSKKIQKNDFFKNEQYFVDIIGKVIINDLDQKIIVHHLYWIATKDKIDMTNEPLMKVETLIYQDYLEQFEKYQYRTLTFDRSEDKVILKKNKIGQ